MTEKQPTHSEQTTLTRREAMGQAANWVENITLTGGLMAKLMVKTMYNFAKTDDERSYGYDNNTKKLTNKDHQFPRGVTIRNLGVFHTDSFLQRHREYLFAAVRDCDVLLTEDIDGPLFDECVQHAFSQQKKVFHIDVHRRNFAQCSELLPIIAGGALTAEQLYSERQKKNKGVNLRCLHTRRNILRVCAAAALGLSAKNGDFQFSREGDTTEKYQRYSDRGRSAAQMKAILDIVESDLHEGTKYLLLTGNSHADLFEDYFADRALLRRDLQRFWLQYQLYGQGSREASSKK